MCECTPELSLRAPSPNARIGLADQHLEIRAGGAATIVVCATASCSAPLRTLDASTALVSIDPPLPPGRYFWRAESGAVATASWAFRVTDGPTWRGRRPFDLDGDGFADVAACVSGEALIGTIAVWPRCDDGLQLEPSRTAQACLDLRTAGDLDDDGFADLFTWPNNTVPIVASDRCRTLDRVLPATSEPIEPEIQGTAPVGDVDGDGVDDVVLFAVDYRPPAASAALIVVYGAADTPGTRRRSIPLGDWTGRVWLAGLHDDWSGDGLDDIVASNDYYGEVRFFSATPGAADAPFLVVDASAGVTFFGGGLAGVGDVDGDGSAELAIAQRDPYAVRLMGVGGHFLPSTYDVTLTTTEPPGVDGPGPVPAGDIDGDGFDDLVVISDSAEYVAFGGPLGVTLVPLAPSPYEVGAPGDVDGDGLSDLVVRTGSGIEVLGHGRALDRIALLSGGGAAFIARGP